MKTITLPIISTALAITLLVMSGQSDDSANQHMKMKRVTDPKIEPKNLSAMSTYTLFDYNQTKAITSGMMPRAGCGCWPDEGPQYQNDMEVSPQTGITAHVAQIPPCRFDIEGLRPAN